MFQEMLQEIQPTLAKTTIGLGSIAVARIAETLGWIAGPVAHLTAIVGLLIAILMAANLCLDLKKKVKQWDKWDGEDRRSSKRKSRRDPDEE